MKHQTEPQAPAEAEVVPSTTQELAVISGETQVAQIDVMAEMIAAAGQGTDYVQTELGVPFLVIAQGTSPEVKEENSKHIPGIKPGMILNKLTGKFVDARVMPNRDVPKGIYVIFGDKVDKKIVEWRPDRGGWVGQHRPESKYATALKSGLNKEGKKVSLSEQGNEMVETDYHRVMVCDDVTALSWAVIGMTSTGLKESRRLNSFINDYRPEAVPGNPSTKFHPPIHSLVFKLQTQILQQKGSENTYWGWMITYIGTVPQIFPQEQAAVWEAAKKFRQAIVDGLVRISAPPVEEENLDVPF